MGAIQRRRSEKKRPHGCFLTKTDVSDAVGTLGRHREKLSQVIGALLPRVHEVTRKRVNTLRKNLKMGGRESGGGSLDVTRIAGRFAGSRGGRYGEKRVYCRSFPHCTSTINWSSSVLVYS